MGGTGAQTSRVEDEGSALQPIIAGAVAALVGFSSTFALVLGGFRAVGATDAQASSGLLVLCLGMAATSVALGVRYRMPINIAWSTPGAALLISSGRIQDGYAAALGAFVVCGLLIVLAGLWSRLGRWLAAIPAPLANAMLAGVLLPVCIAPVRAAAEIPALALPGIAVWAVVSRISRRWAVPAALVVTAVAIAINPSDTSGTSTRLLPVLTFVTPAFGLAAIFGLALPLFIVTMASQNVPGMSVLASNGYRPPLRQILLTTGAATAVGAPFGSQAFNLAAITAAMIAGPDAHPDRERRWIATVSAGLTYAVLGLGAGLATALVAAAPPVLIEAVAGLALLGALAASLSAALREEELREAAVVTFAVTASSVTIASISAPFWGLVAGLALLAATRRVRRPARL